MKRRGVVAAGLLGAPVVLLAMALGGHAAFAQAALPDPGSATAFMHAEFGLLIKAVLWLFAVVAGLAALVFGYLLLRWVVRNGLSGSRISPETFTAVGWIVLPLVILAVIVVPAIELLYQSDEAPYVTVRVTAHEWYWQYDYVSVPGLGFASHVIPDSQLRPGQVAGGSADHPLVLPAGKKVQFIVSSADVLHGFFVPPLGVEIYAVPSAMLNGWTIIKKPGVYFGHSSSICGNNHPPMPIEIRAVPLKDYLAWSKAALSAAQASQSASLDGMRNGSSPAA